jgi:hypothetical protein
MDAIEFACFFERFQKSIGLEIDPEIVGEVYDHYEGSYENYTLLELISMLSMKQITIDCEFNKKAIIEMIKTQKIDIPKRYEPMQPTTWWLEEGKRYNHIFVPNMYFAFYEGDIFKTHCGIIWELVDIQRDNDTEDAEDAEENQSAVYMHFINKDTGDDIYIEAGDFIYSLDYQDTTIVYNNNMILKKIMPEK